MTSTHRTLLAGASVLTLALMLGLPRPAMAAGISLPTRSGTDPTNPGTVDGLLSLNSNVSNGPLNPGGAGPTYGATVTGSSGQVSQTLGTSTSATTIGTNLIGAYGVGNAQANTIALGAAVLPGFDPGAALLAVSTNTSTLVTSLVQGSSLAATANNLLSGTLASIDNTITASTLLNRATNLASGAVPLGFNPTTGGSTVFSNTGTLLTSSGGIVLGNAQTNTGGPPSSASLGFVPLGAPSPNAITLKIDNTAAAGTLAASPDLSRNTLSAIFKGNSADNAVRVLTGAAPILSSSIALANTQENAFGGTAIGTATNLGSQVTATITGPTPLSGVLSVRDNVIAATAVGNEALTPNGANAPSGNVVSLADGVGLSNASSQNNSITGTGTPVPVATVAGALGVLNVQRNVTTDPGNPAELTATTSGGSITGVVSTVAGGAVSLTGNRIDADSKGNRAANAITAGGASTASLVGATSLGSVQTNDGVALSAVNGVAGSGNAVTAAVGGLTGGAAAVDANRIGSTAYGNTVANTIQLTATTLAANPAGMPVGGRLNSTSSQQLAFGTTTISSVQANLSTTAAGSVAATTTSPLVALTAGGFGTPLSGASLSTSRNTLTAEALANSLASSVTLAATTASGSAGVAGWQTSETPVTATLTDPTVRVTANGSSIANTTVAASDNLARALAYGNQASNALSATVTTLTAARTATTAPSYFFQQAYANPFSPDVTAALTVLGNQNATGNVTANATRSNAAPVVGIALGGPLSGGSVTGDGNALIGAARGNSATNALNLAATTVEAAGAGPDLGVARVGNMQSVGSGVAILGTAASGPGFVTIVGGSIPVDGSVLSTSRNTQAAVATGSEATNTLSALANTMSLMPTNGGQNGTVQGSPTFVGVLTSVFGVLSDQISSGGTRTATATGVGTATTLGTVTRGTVSAVGNELSASATDNTVTNALTIGGVRAADGSLTPAAVLATTAGVLNLQNSGAAVSATLGAVSAPVGVAIATGAATASALTASDNLLQASAAANQATNTLAASAVTLTAPGATMASNTNSAFAMNGNTPIVNGTLALLTNQLTQSTGVTASATQPPSLNAPISIIAGGPVSGGSMVADGNRLAAAARGNSASNGLDVAATTIGLASGVANPSVAVIGNVQTVANTPILATAATDANLLTIGAVGLSNAQVSASRNTQSALAVGNTASSRLTALTNTISAPSGTTSGGTVANFLGAATTNAGLSINNLQSGSGSRTAALTGDGIVLQPGAIDTSSVVAQGNAFLADALDNTAINALAIGGPSIGGVATPATSVATTAAVQNIQQSTSALTATVGAAGAPVGVALRSGPVTGSSLTLSQTLFRAAATVNDATNSLTVNATGVSADRVAGGAGGFSPAGGGSFLTATTAADFALSNNQLALSPQFGPPQSVQATATTLLTNTTAGNPGPTLGSSTLSVVDNTMLARAQANNAVNSLVVGAGAGQGASAGLVNTQDAARVVLANAAGAAITLANASVSASTVTLSGNSSQAIAQANAATNTLGSEGGAGLNGNAALASLQRSAGQVTANGGLALTYAAGSVTGSTIEMVGNLSSAVAGGNTATNTLTAAAGATYGSTAQSGRAQSGSSLLTGSTGPLPLAPASGLQAAAQSALLNGQTNTANIVATNTSTITLAAAGLGGSSAVNSGNLVRAIGYANSATNTIALNALPAGLSTAALTNQQMNTGNVSAMVSNSVIGLTGTGLTGGNVLGVSGNQIMAQATGNSVTNIISILPGTRVAR